MDLLGLEGHSHRDLHVLAVEERKPYILTRQHLVYFTLSFVVVSLGFVRAVGAFRPS